MISTYVSSSNIDRIGYRLGKLYVQFKTGACYMYENVPYTVYDALQKVESAGQYFHRVVKCNEAIRCTKLSSSPF